MASRGEAVIDKERALQTRLAASRSRVSSRSSIMWSSSGIPKTRRVDSSIVAIGIDSV